MLNSPEVSVWFQQREDAEVLAALTASDFDAVAVVEYPRDGAEPRLVGFEGSDTGRALIAAELSDPLGAFEPGAELLFDGEEGDDDEEGVCGGVTIRVDVPRRKFDA
jgi:hypothetical protein